MDILSQSSIDERAMHLWRDYAPKRLRGLLRATEESVARFAVDFGPGVAWDSPVTTTPLQDILALRDLALAKYSNRLVNKTQEPGRFTWQPGDLWDTGERIPQPKRALFAFNPQEARDWHGKWTEGGQGAKAASALVDAEGNVLDPARYDLEGKTFHTGDKIPRGRAKIAEAWAREVATRYGWAGPAYDAIKAYKGKSYMPTNAMLRNGGKFPEWDEARELQQFDAKGEGERYDLYNKDLDVREFRSKHKHPSRADFPYGTGYDEAAMRWGAANHFAEETYIAQQREAYIDYARKDFIRARWAGFNDRQGLWIAWGGEGAVQPIIDGLDKMFAQPETVSPDNVVVYRRGHLPRNLEDGAVLQDDAFVSTTLDDSTTDMFQGQLFSIEIPKGTKAAFIDNVTGGREAEVLLPRGAQFVVLGGEREVEARAWLQDRGPAKLTRLRYLGTDYRLPDTVKPSKFARLVNKTLEQNANGGAQFAYNPAEARDDGGRWTTGGPRVAAATATPAGAGTVERGIYGGNENAPSPERASKIHYWIAANIAGYHGMGNARTGNNTVGWHSDMAVAAMKMMRPYIGEEKYPEFVKAHFAWTWLQVRLAAKERGYLDAEFAYNPAESRDWHGKWVKGGGNQAPVQTSMAVQAPDTPPYKTYINNEAPVLAAYKGWADSLAGDADVMRSVNMYTATAYEEINPYLREGKALTASEGNNVPEFITAIDRALNAPGAVAPSNMVVFRSGHLPTEGYSVGSIHQDKGYVSTSLDYEVTEDFTDQRFAIEIPRGSKAAYLDALVGGDEQELLLPHGSRFMYVGNREYDGVGYGEMPAFRYLGPEAPTVHKASKRAKFSRTVRPSVRRHRFVWMPGDLIDVGKAHFAYNPAESRDFHGRWVRGAGVGRKVQEATATAVASASTKEQAAKPSMTFRISHVEGRLEDDPDMPGVSHTVHTKTYEELPDTYNVPGPKSHIKGRPTISYVNPEIAHTVEQANETEGRLNGWADEHGITVDEYKAQAQAHLEDLVANAKVAVRRSANSIPLILGAGRFKTAFDNDVSNPKNSAAEYAEAERILWGYPPRLKDPAQRLVYAYLTDDPDTEAPDGSYLNDYGDVTVVLKDSVRPRTTFSLHDSMGTIANEQYMGIYAASTVPMAKPSLLAYHQDEIDILAMEHIQDAEQYTSSSAFAYAEAQVHEGVKAADIDHVVLPSDWAKLVEMVETGKPYTFPGPNRARAVVAALRANGVPYTVAKSRTERTPEQVRADMEREAHQQEDAAGRVTFSALDFMQGKLGGTHGR